MAKRTIPFNRTGIGGLSIDKPVLYEIQTEGGKTNYIGVAQRGRAQERLAEHLPGGKDPVPGSQVRVQQVGSIDEAKKMEQALIERVQPKYNTNHK